MAINSRVALRMQGSLVQEQILALYCAWGIYKGPWGRLGGLFAPLGKAHRTAHEQPESSSSVWLGYSSPRTERLALLADCCLPRYSLISVGIYEGSDSLTAEGHQRGL